MPLQDDPARSCLKLDKWPQQDREAFLAALGDDDPLSASCGAAAHWRPDTIHKNRRGYGRYLTFVIGQDSDLSGSPGCRVTKTNVRAYLDELAVQQVSAYTRRNRIFELYAVIKAIEPDGDWRWLRMVATNLGRVASQSRNRSEPKVLGGTILRYCLNQLTGLSDERVETANAITFRNWLLILMLALLPIRRSNIAGLSFGHVSRRNGFWQIDLGRHETKGHRPFCGPLPEMADRFVAHYLRQVRPVLVKRNPLVCNDAFWLTGSGRPLASQTIYLMVRRLTSKAFGQR